MTTDTIQQGNVDSSLYGHREAALADRLALARQAGIAARAARANSSLRSDFLDADNWADLAHIYGLRLPVWGTPCTTGALTRWLKRAGFSVAWYREWSGYQSLQQWIDANPRWPLRAFAGLLLQEREAAEYAAANL